MTDVKAGVEYKINIDGNSFLLDSKKFKLLESILDSGSLTEAAKSINVSYRTALNYIDKIEYPSSVREVPPPPPFPPFVVLTILTSREDSILSI